MIKFIQKYQKFFFIVVTAAVVVTFSFFGAGPSMNTSNFHEQIAFKTVDGDKISRGELEEMVNFIKTDTYDQRVLGPRSGVNFMNDGVIRNDFLATGMADLLVNEYPNLVKKDLETRLEREKRFTPYAHPKAPFISAEMVWNYFSPSLKQNLEQLQKAQDPLSQQAFQNRVNLYLAEREFPAPYLTEVLRRQESQYGWVEKDPSLSNRDLSLFNYHTIEDWFGPRFTRLIAEFIFNAAAVAEQKGYKVTSAEAWADLVKNGSQSYQELSKTENFPFTSQSQYMNDQLRNMGLDAGKATQLWQKVLLFRRVFHDIANAQMVEPQTLYPSNAWTSETIVGDFYRLPKELRFSDMMDLAEFEVYLAATSKGDKTLAISDTPLPAAEIQKRNPELVEKRYLTVIKKADKKTLESKVSMRETLDWELDPANFALLKKEFADLGIKTSDTLDQRIEALDSLPDTMRLKVDAFARTKIALMHPEWVEQALMQSKADAQVISLRQKGGKDPLTGIKDRKNLQDTFDKAKINEEFTLNGDNVVYLIKIIDRSQDLEIVSFENAKNGGILGELLMEKLAPVYQEARGKDDKFKKENGEYKPLADVKREVAEIWLAPKLKEIKTDADASLKNKAPANMIPDIAATLRFTGWAEKVKSASNKDTYVKQELAMDQDPEKLPSKMKWNDQFKWEKEKKKVSRGTDEGLFDKDKLYALKDGEFSPLLTPSNGDLMFVQLDTRLTAPNSDLLAKETVGVRAEIGAEAERIYMKELLTKIKADNAISLDYMNVGEEIIEPESDEANQDV